MLAAMNVWAAAAAAWWQHLEKVLDRYGGWLLVVVVVAVLLALPLARLLRSNPLVTGLLAVSLLAVVALSLAPSSTVQAAAGVCLRPVTWPVGRRALWPSDLIANVWMYVPLGIAVVSLRPRLVRLVAIVAALLVPLLLEFTQKEVLILNRQCSLSDVIGNEVGLALGMVVGPGFLLCWRLIGPGRSARNAPPPAARPVAAPERAPEEIPTR
jgi:VanZ family protein